MISCNETYRHGRSAIGARAIILVAMIGCTGATAATADYHFTGRWRMDTSSLKRNLKPTIIRLVDGSFKRDDNQPLQADG